MRAQPATSRLPQRGWRTRCGDDVTYSHGFRTSSTTPQALPFLTTRTRHLGAAVRLGGELARRGYRPYNRVADIVKPNAGGDGPLTVHVPDPGHRRRPHVAGAQDAPAHRDCDRVLGLRVLLVVNRNPITNAFRWRRSGCRCLPAQGVVGVCSPLSDLEFSIIPSSLERRSRRGKRTTQSFSQPLSRLSRQGRIRRAVKRALIAIGKMINRIRFNCGNHFSRITSPRWVCSPRSVACGSGWDGILSRVTCCRPSWSWPCRAAGPATARLTARSATFGASHCAAAETYRRHLLVLPFFASCAATSFRYTTYRHALGSSAPSSIGYAALERHFPISQAVPEYSSLSSHRGRPADNRRPSLTWSRMAQRVSQLPTHRSYQPASPDPRSSPAGISATYQAGPIGGDRMATGSAQTSAARPRPSHRRGDGAGTLAATS